MKQAVALWQTEDGSWEDYAALCKTYNAKTAAERQAIFFVRMQDNFELLWGSFNKMSVGLKIPLHVDEGEILPIDLIFGGYSAGAHLSSDFFANKLAFITVLNFPHFRWTKKNVNGR